MIAYIIREMYFLCYRYKIGRNKRCVDVDVDVDVGVNVTKVVNVDQKKDHAEVRAKKH